MAYCDQSRQKCVFLRGFLWLMSYFVCLIYYCPCSTHLISNTKSLQLQHIWMEQSADYNNLQNRLHFAAVENYKLAWPNYTQKGIIKIQNIAQKAASIRKLNSQNDFHTLLELIHFDCVIREYCSEMTPEHWGHRYIFSTLQRASLYANMPDWQDWKNESALRSKIVFQL